MFRIYSGQDNDNLSGDGWPDECIAYSGVSPVEVYRYNSISGAYDHLHSRSFYEGAINEPALVEVDGNSDGDLDDAADHAYIPVLDDRGTVMGVATGKAGTYNDISRSAGDLIEKIYYNSTGLVRAYYANGTFNSQHPNRSSYIDYGWCGMPRSRFTGLYHTHYRDYDAIHGRWLKEDPAGYADGLNLFNNYAGVNGVDALGLDITTEEIVRTEKVGRKVYKAVYTHTYDDGQYVSTARKYIDVRTGETSDINPHTGFTSEQEKYYEMYRQYFIMHGVKGEWYLELMGHEGKYVEFIDYDSEDMEDIGDRVIGIDSRLSSRAAADALYNYLDDAYNSYLSQALDRLADVVNTRIQQLNDASGGGFNKFHLDSKVMVGKLGRHIQDGLRDELIGMAMGYAAGKAIGIAVDAVGAIGDARRARTARKLASLGCFVAGTIVQTESGEARIEDIDVGDIVYAFDLHSKQWQQERVEQTFVHDYYGDIITVTVGEETIKATGNHPFWVVSGLDLSARPRIEGFSDVESSMQANGRWVEARDLQASDVLWSKPEGNIVINEISSEVSSQKVYNVEVSELHNYLVGSTGLLVHNKPVPAGRLPIKWTRKNAQKVLKTKWGKLYQDPDTKLWWAKDRAGHGGSKWKVFKKEGGGFRWLMDADEFGDEIYRKHKGPVGMFIKMKDVSGI